MTTLYRRLILAVVYAALATAAMPATALEGGFDCAEGADGEIEPYIWNGDEWVPNPDYVKLPTS